MKISIVIPSLLEHYKDAAINREQKLFRALKSIYAQTYQDFEIIFVCDNCKRSLELAIAFKKEHGDSRLKIYNYETEKKRVLFSAYPRNTGLSVATGDFICYLDIDDYFGENHLMNISKGITDDIDWIWFDDLVWNPGDKWTIQKRDVTKIYHCGTSNIAHKNSSDIFWIDSGYRHDWYFIDTLRNKFKKYKYVEGSEYRVCHLIGIYDV